MSKIDGFQSALEALRALDAKSQERILGDILKSDPKLAERLKQNLVIFSDLLKVNPQGLTKLFSEVPDAKWVMALRGHKPEFVDEMLKTLPTRKADLIKSAIQHLGPQPLSKVEAAQKEVLNKALELESKGELLFARDSDPLVK